jgi:hypothetical protein
MVASKLISTAIRNLTGARRLLPNTSDRRFIDMQLKMLADFNRKLAIKEKKKNG